MHQRAHPARTHPLLLTDGGEPEEADENEGGDGEEDAEETGDENGEGADDAEGEQDQAEEGYEEEEGTNVLHLDLEGLFLDLLGLELDLQEVVLDLRAVPGDGNLLGNLLGQVAGLLDDGLMSGIGGLLGNLGGGSLSELPGRIGGWIREQFDSLIESIPIEDIVVGVVNELLQELFDSVENGADSEGE